MPRGSPRLRSADKLNGVGERAKARRTDLSMTQDAVCARLSQITDGQWIPDWRDIYRIESGTRIVSDLELLAVAAALECDPCWLLIGDGPSA